MNNLAKLNNLNVEQNSINKCDICDKEFQTNNVLKKHLNGIHARMDEIHKCVICNKSFNTELAVTLHNKTHERTKNNKCDLCDKFYSNASNLKIHVKYDGIGKKL